SRVEIRELETAGELHDRLAEDGATLVPRVVEELIGGSSTETAQDESLATVAPKMSREQSKIDFTRRASEIANQIRGMYPWPGCRAKLLDESGKEIVRVTLVRARPTAGAAAAGSICADGLVGSGDGAIEIVEL